MQGQMFSFLFVLETGFFLFFSPLSASPLSGEEAEEAVPAFVKFSVGITVLSLRTQHSTGMDGSTTERSSFSVSVFIPNVWCFFGKFRRCLSADDCQTGLDTVKETNTRKEVRESKREEKKVWLVDSRYNK